MKNVHKARQIVLALALDRHDKAVGADGNDRLTQNLCVGRRGDDLLQRFADLCALLANLPADGGQLIAGGVRDLVLRGNAGIDLLFQILIGHQLEEPRIEHSRDAVAVRIILDHPGRLETARDLEQLLRAEDAAAVGAGQRRAHVADTAEARRTFERNELAGIACFLLERADIVRVRERRHGAAFFLCRIASGVLCQKLQDLVKLQLFQGFFV